jgi:hypothetical protein
MKWGCAMVNPSDTCPAPLPGDPKAGDSTGRPIYKRVRDVRETNRNESYLYYWAGFDNWLIGPDYKQGTAWVMSTGSTKALCPDFCAGQHGLKKKTTSAHRVLSTNTRSRSPYRRVRSSRLRIFASRVRQAGRARRAPVAVLALDVPFFKMGRQGYMCIRICVCGCRPPPGKAGAPGRCRCGPFPSHTRTLMHAHMFGCRGVLR